MVKSDFWLWFSILFYVLGILCLVPDLFTLNLEGDIKTVYLSPFLGFIGLYFSKNVNERYLRYILLTFHTILIFGSVLVNLIYRLLVIPV